MAETAEKPRWNFKVFLVLLFLVYIYWAWSTSGQPNHRGSPFGRHSVTTSLIDRDVAIPARRYFDVSFTVPAGESATISGHFEAEGGGGNDTDVLVVGDDGLENWANGHAWRGYYNSGRATAGQIAAGPLGPGRYHLVFSNTFSLISNKVVAVSATETVDY